MKYGVTKNTLLITAGIVWLLAGINILLEGLLALGANVDTDIPDRMKDGYGLNKNLSRRLIKKETCFLK